MLSSLVSQALTRVYGQRYGIGIPEWRVLVTLGQYGVMTGKAVGAHTHMHKTKVSRAVAQLEQRKFVARRANRADLREAFLSLTPAGRAVYEEVAPIALEFTNRLSEVVAPADRAAFDRAMRQLTERSAKLVIEIEGGDELKRPRRDPPRRTAHAPHQQQRGHRDQLYSYFRSSAAYRVRIAFNLKGLSFETTAIHLQKEGGLNRKPEYRAINPQMRVPALRLDSGEVLTQSLAIIEYLDEIHPQPPLLPRDPRRRARRCARSRS